MMALTRYIIWTTSFEDTNIIMNAIEPHSEVVISISDTIVCIESKLTSARIRAYVGEDMEMACLEMDQKFIDRLQNKKLKDVEKKNFLRFLEMTKVPTTIDEGLDLISKRGGIKFLNEREIHALDRLTKNPPSDT